MTSSSKRKGNQWERDLAELLTKTVKKSIFRRVAGSGALGTIMFEPTLSSDVKGKVESIPQEFKVECKVGYGGSTQLTIKKEWFDKVREEAARSFGIPFVACKFSGAREGTRYFIAMDVEVFADLVNRITEQYEYLLKINKTENINDR
jgi:Holliday junction resolvase